MATETSIICSCCKEVKLETLGQPGAPFWCSSCDGHAGDCIGPYDHPFGRCRLPKKDQE